MKKQLFFSFFFFLLSAASSFAQCSVKLSIIDSISCHGICDGLLEAQETGNGALAYAWAPNVATTQDATGLCAGSYTVTMTDGLGCIARDSIVFKQPDTLLVFVDSIRNVACPGANNGFVFIHVTGGTPSYIYNWTDANFSTTKNLDSTAGGNYAVYVSDYHNCFFYKDNIIVNEPDPYFIYIFPTSVNCYGDATGSVQLQIQGGTPPYSYKWTPSVSSDSFPQNLPKGNYCVKITDYNKCIIAADTCTFLDQQQKLLNHPSYINPSCIGCSDGKITVSPTGGMRTYYYSWDFPITSTDSEATGLPAGTYNICTSDIFGCTTCDSITLSDPLFSQNLKNDLSVSIYPNPSNGRFSIIFNTSVHNATISITNLLGQEVYRDSFVSITGNKKDIELTTPAGIYFVQVLNESGKWVGSFVKQ